MSCGCSACVLAGPAVMPVSLSVAHTNVTPETNIQGSVNQGGGGGGGGSGCGKPAEPNDCVKKSASCGGGGGGCGSSKTKKPEPEEFMVAFVDYEANPILTDWKGQPLGEGPVQKVAKDSAAQKPWESKDDAEKHPQGLVPGFVFKEWKTVPECNLSAVSCDCVAYPIYELMNMNDLEDEVNSISDSIQEINDMTSECIDSYNDEIYNCIDNIDDSTRYITGSHINSRSPAPVTDGIMNIIESHMSEIGSEEKAKVYNISKCMLNIQSCYIFQTRMLFNDECMDCNRQIDINKEDLIKKLMNNIDTDKSLKDKLNVKNDISADINDAKQNIELMLYDIHEDNAESFSEYITSLNSLIDDLNKCFPEPIVEKI